MGRNKVRFKPDENTMAFIAYDTDGEEHSIIALVDNESFEGAGLVINQDFPLEVGDNCILKVGDLASMRAELRWKKQLEGKIYRLGFHYLE